MRRTGQPTPIKLWHLLVAGLAYALLTALSVPPIGFWPLALTAPIPLIWAAARSGRVSLLGAACLSLGTLPVWAYTHLFLLNVTQVGFPLLCVYLSVYPALFVALHRLTRRLAPGVPTALTAPVVWVAIEWFRGEVVFTGYPWYSAGLPLVELPLLASPGALFGMYFVSLLTVALGGALADAAGWTGRPRRVGGIAASAVVVLWAACIAIARGESPPRTETLRVAIVQTNVAQDNKIAWRATERLLAFRRFLDLTRQAAVRTPPPDVIFWPETMFPGAALNPEAIAAQRNAAAQGLTMPLDKPMIGPEGQIVKSIPLTFFADELLERQRELGVPLVVGAIALDNLHYVEQTAGGWLAEYDHRFNSTFVIADGRVDPDRYDKIDLTPFGEVIPYAWRVPVLQQRLLSLGAAGMSFDLSYGGGPALLSVPIKRASGQIGRGEVYIATPICFEVTKPSTCRALAVGVPGRKASMLFNPSNDGWFADYPGREVHLQLARWRCVELGLPMVRSVNTGLSCVIDSHGRVTELGPAGADRPARTDGVLAAAVPIVPTGAPTLFARWGEAPLLVMLAVMALAVGVWPTVERKLILRNPLV